MGDALTPAQTLERYQSVLGSTAGREFYFFKQNFLNAVHMWGVHHAMFETNDQRVDLMNAASGPAAAEIQRALRQSVILALCRLCDPAASGRGGARPNLAVKRIGASLNLEGADWAACVAEVDACIPDLRRMRDKMLAHNDLATASAQAQISQVDAGKIDGVVNALGDCIDFIYQSRFGTAYVWDLIFDDGKAAALNLLSTLATGVAEQRLWRDPDYVRAFHTREGRFPWQPIPDWLKRD